LLTTQRITSNNPLNIAFHGKDLFLDAEWSRHPKKGKDMEARAINITSIGKPMIKDCSKK